MRLHYHPLSPYARKAATAIALFFFKVTEVWCKWLNRRSQRTSMTWPRMHRLMKRYPLPRPRIAHPLLPRVASP